MKKKRLTFGILLLLGIFLAGYLVNFIMDDSKDSATEARKDERKIEFSKYPGVDLVTEITEKKTHKMAIHYPKFTIDTLNSEIEKYVSDIEKRFLTDVEGNKEFINNHTAELSLSIEIYPIMENVYSIVFSNESYVTGANSQQEMKAYIVDTQKGNFIKATEIFKDTKSNRDQLYTLLHTKLKESKQYAPFLFEDELRIWAQDPNNTFKGMYLKEKSIVFQFDKYEVTAGAAGMPKIAIPFDEMQSLLTDEWSKKLHINGAQTKDPDRNSDDKNIVQDEKPKQDHNSSSGRKKVALTFDDGPHPKNTLKILDLLDKYDAKATFFMLGNRVDFYPDIVKKVADQGHELGNHTWNHKDLTAISKEEGIQEVERTNVAIRNAAGRDSTVFRPPYGAMNKQVNGAISSPAVLWSIDTLDWKSHNPDEILKIVQQNVKDGSIILMHDIHKTTVEAVEPILKYLKKEGYECVTVSEL